ncbi:MAG: Holliday junction resolvase RuvX [Bacteroidales bacterium]|nr:Holliday junction resolvase RuvX [Bacteroidales bacterium]
MGRILAIDYGKKRTGLAVTDPDRIIASPLETIATNKLEEFLVDYINKNDVDTIVIGYPKTMNNQPSGIVKQLNPFINRLRKIFNDIDIHLVDERFTSSIAQQAMIEGGMKKSERRKKENIDRISASLILQSYMKQTKNYSK